MRTRILLLLLPLLVACTTKPAVEKPRVLVSTDIGGSDADDKQSFTHLMMMTDRFDLEGLVSTPGGGSGDADEMFRMIDVFEQDYPRLKAAYPGLMAPDELRPLVKRGFKGSVPFQGHGTPTEGSEWIVSCARKDDSRPLWVLVWGGLSDLAQALHDAPDIADRIRVYFIGGPNKGGVNSYHYIAENFPELWMIEDNASYRGFIWDAEIDDEYNNFYYDAHIAGRGHLADDFLAYYNGHVKMGDSPSLFYVMDGDPDDPEGESWGGSFTPTRYSTRTVFDRMPTMADSIPVYSVFELRLKGPQLDLPVGTPAFYVQLRTTPLTEVYYPDPNAPRPGAAPAPVPQAAPAPQPLPASAPSIPAPRYRGREGYYAGNGEFVFRYVPKAPFRVEITLDSDYPELNGLGGSFIVADGWPGRRTPDSYALGGHWYTDRGEAEFYEHGWQGYRTVSAHRNAVLDDWAERWQVLMD